MTYDTDESVSSLSMWNIMNQSGKQDFSCGQAVDNLRGMKFVPD